MIINKLSLNNFMCYYDCKSFEFADGLNIILGHNGDGKSTIFLAFNWIFDQYSKLDLSEVYSKKKFAEILDNETFDVYVECTVTQFNDEYKIVKSFTVTKITGNSVISSIKEEIWRRDLITGERAIDNRTISKLSQQVFPEAFRNFSMFETETDALKIVEGSHLADLVKNFSNAKHYQKLDEVIESFAERADKQFRRESKSDKAAQDAVDEIDGNIVILKKELKSLSSRIEEDEKGKDFYSDKIIDLVRNMSISEEYNRVESQIENLKADIERARLENRSRSRFTDKIFDNFYVLSGFEKIVVDFTAKINNLRQEKNRVDNLERNRFAMEKLELGNLSTPLPPGFPSLDILKEILEDDICKICNTPIADYSREYINKSIQIYEESKKNGKELKMPNIFPNNFIDEFQIIERSIQLKPDLYSAERISDEIEFGIKRFNVCNESISENNGKLDALYIQKKELLGKAHNLTEDELRNIRLLHEKYSNEKDTLVGRISENRTHQEMKNVILSDLEKKRKNTLAQFKDSDFRQSTVEVLESLSGVAKKVKDEEYEKFLKVLSEGATSYLKQINIGEITGKIELYKKNDKEVAYKSFNDDNSIRSSLEDSGALQISKPLSILFAIADIAAETSDNETYPMIFDAPTGRFSTDREREFFKVLKQTKKQRIVVTLRFLGADKSNTPYVDFDLFQNIEKDKAFFIKRIRPYDKSKPETISTEVEVIV